MHYSVILWVRMDGADLSTSFWMIDTWAGLAHAPQMCCFSPFWGDFSLFRVYSLNY